MQPIQPSRPGRFSFVDEGEAVRRLNVSRETLLELVASKRLRAYPGVGKGNFFRVGDLDKLAEELHPAVEAPATMRGVDLLNPANQRRQHDPAYKVHLRIQADLKWYDLSDDDLQAYVRELHPAAYEKQRSNVMSALERLERLVALMDEAAERWRAQGTAETGSGETGEGTAGD
jgi:helix-turn-helix protein